MFSCFFIEDPKQHAKWVQIQSSARAWYFSASDFKSLCGVVVPCSPPIYAVSFSQEEMEALVLQALSFKANNMTGLYESVWGSRLECISHLNALLRVLQSKGLTWP